MKHVLAVLVLAALPVFAQQQTNVAQEIVVTASALPEHVEETPASVTVITHEDIEARAARDVSDVLREVPGLTVARIGSAGRAFRRGDVPPAIGPWSHTQRQVERERRAGERARRAGGVARA